MKFIISLSMLLTTATAATLYERPCKMIGTRYTRPSCCSYSQIEPPVAGLPKAEHDVTLWVSCVAVSTSHHRAPCKDYEIGAMCCTEEIFKIPGVAADGYACRGVPSPKENTNDDTGIWNGEDRGLDTD